MKKICRFLVIIVLSLIVVNPISASTNTFPRNNDNNYGIKKNIKVTEGNIDNIKDTKYVKASEKIYDFSDILTDAEEKELKTLIDKFIEKTGMDMVILTDNYSYSSDFDNAIYATDFYDYNDFGLDYKNYSGVILFRNTYPSNPFYNVYTTGDAQIYFSDSRCDDVLDAIYNDFVSHNYLVGMKKFINELSLFYDDGIPQGYEEAYIDELGNLVIPKHYNPPYLIAALIGLFTTGITTKVLVSKNKMVYKAKEADKYLKSDTIKYNRQDSRLVSTHTTSHYDPPSNSSSGGGHSFSGSSGLGHGGGGGRHG